MAGLSERLASAMARLRIEGMRSAVRRSTVADTGRVVVISPYDGEVGLLDVTRSRTAIGALWAAVPVGTRPSWTIAVGFPRTP